MNANSGFKKFCDPEVTTMIKKFTQLNEGEVPGEPVVIPTDASRLINEQKLKALSAVNITKKKWDGVIKGGSCLDGSKKSKT